MSQLFSRRGYNIQSLAVGPTERPDISRLTLRVDCSEHSLEQIEKQMHKLVNVLRVTELHAGRGRRARARADHRRSAARAPRRADRAQPGLRRPVADLGRDAITFEIVGRPEQLDAFEELVRPYGVRELARTGRIGLRRPSAQPRAPSVSRLASKGPPPMAEIIKTGQPRASHGKVAVLGYGSQGHAHALNLADSGVEVEVGLREGSPSWAAAEEAGLTVETVAEAVQGAQLVAFLVPDGAQPELYEDEVAPNLEPGAALLFAHGFNVHYGRIAPPEGHDVIMVAPKGPGHVVRRLYTEGYGTPALVAVAQDASGYGARARARLRRRASAPRARAWSRRPSRRRPRPTSSASRPCSAAASRS